MRPDEEGGIRRSAAALIVAVALGFGAGAMVGRSSAPASSPTGAPASGTPVDAAAPTPDGPIVLTEEFEPYPYMDAPPRERTALDGFYLRVVTLEEAGGPKLGIPVHCLRCVPYSVDAGVETLLLYEGRYFLEHQINGFRALGHYVVRGDRLVLFNDPNCSRTRGVYRWTLEGHSLTLHEIDDPCPFVDERQHDLTYSPWTAVDACTSGIRDWYPALIGC